MSYAGDPHTDMYFIHVDRKQGLICTNLIQLREILTDRGHVVDALQ
jgi:hypothetical protein